MTGKGDEPSTTDGLQYPMVDLFTGGTILPLMFINAAATCYLLSLTAPLAFMEAWKALETPNSPAPNPPAGNENSCNKNTPCNEKQRNKSNEKG
jgi:hypothetical protein